MLRATHQPAGTATNVFGQFEIPVAGKTGTAQRVGEPDYAVFASYAPAPDPKLVTAIVIERGGHGGVAGALTALDFYSKVFKVKKPNLGTVVDESTDVQRPDPRRAGAHARAPPHAGASAPSGACGGSTG